MANWLNLGQMLKMNALKYPDTVCLMDAERSYTYSQTNQRVCRLANGLLSLGLKKGDTISVFLENCIEFVELYLACAKTGLIINPINFRLTPKDTLYIANHAQAQAFVVHDIFANTVNQIRSELDIADNRIIMVGEKQDGYLPYDTLIKTANASEPKIVVRPQDTWVLLYTSGTTGRPKGVLRSHESYIAFYLINAIDFGFRPHDRVLNVMPLCHVNTTYFTFTFTYIGATTYIAPAIGFKPEAMLATVDRAKISFISLIPTHYALILALPADVRAKYDLSSIKKLLCSSAPARIEHKKGIMQVFENVELYEGYGSTESGIVTTLMPHEQLRHPTSIGKESLGTDAIKILDENHKEVPRGQIGELYSRGPMMFDGYYKEPQKTASAFVGEWFSAGDMAYQDEEGYYYLVDRKNNLIITGGEHVYPTEVEKTICGHEAVLDAAVIGVPDTKWGEAVQAVVVLKDDCACTEQELAEFCREKLAAYKRPKSVQFIAPNEMPRTNTGKIVHRLLRERFCKERDEKS